MNDDVYISYKEINDILQFNKNIYRSKPIMIDALNVLKNNNLIDFTEEVTDVNNNIVVKFKWIKQFPNYGGVGWIKFYADDFEIHSKIGNVPYLVMWLLRMYKNHETDSSFIAITDITSILECSRNKVQNSISLFKEYGLFEVVTGRYYKNDELGRYIRKNNDYKYTEYIDGVLNADQNDINKFLFPVNNKL